MPSRILIVDDRDANLRVVEEILAPLGQTVVTASSGDQALKEVLRSDFAVILMDVKMPGLDGFETAALIRAKPRTRNTPIVFLTAQDGSFADAQRAYDLGAFDYLTKPFEPSILLYKVSAFVRLDEQAAQLRALASELEAERDALLEARETARLRDVFVGVLGHDLRNPLAAASLAIDTLRRDPELPDRYEKNLARLKRSVDRMQGLVNDVLDFARGQMGNGIPVTLEAASLQGISQRIVEELETAHPGRRLVVTVDGNTDGNWDAARLAQVVSNLVANALQHCAADPVEVRLAGTAHQVQLTVTNAGAIDPDIVPRLFEPFRRGDSSAAGLGLGLYIVREIVIAHSGTVVIETNPDANQTSFVVTLPRSPKPPAA